MALRSEPSPELVGDERTPDESTLEQSSRREASPQAARADARRDEPPRSFQFQRLVTFSDAVFAIAATLLFIDLRPPEASAEAYEAALRHYLGDPAPFLATTIGFIVVGSFWSSHRRSFALLRETSGAIVWANLAFLFFVAIQPFLTAALAEHDPNTTSVLLYSAGELATCLAQLVVWFVALRTPELLTDRATPRRIRYVTLQLLRAPVTFAVSIPITLSVGPTAGMTSWLLMVVLAVVITRSQRDLDDVRSSRSLHRRRHRLDPARTATP